MARKAMREELVNRSWMLKAASRAIRHARSAIRINSPWVVSIFGLPGLGANTRVFTCERCRDEGNAAAVHEADSELYRRKRSAQNPEEHREEAAEANQAA